MTLTQTLDFLQTENCYTKPTAPPCNSIKFPADQAQVVWYCLVANGLG